MTSHLIEVERSQLGLIVDGALFIHSGDGHLHRHLLHVLREEEDCFTVISFYFFDIHRFVVYIIDHRLDRNGSFQRKSAILVRVPCFGAAKAHQIIGLHPHSAFQGLVTMLQIDDDAMLALFGEGIAVHADVIGGSHLSLDSIVELHHVVARFRFLVLMGEGKGIFLVDDGRFSDERGDENVAIVRAPCTA